MTFVYKIKAHMSVDVDVCCCVHVSVSALVFCDCCKNLSLKQYEFIFLGYKEGSALSPSLTVLPLGTPEDNVFSHFRCILLPWTPPSTSEPRALASVL